MNTIFSFSDFLSLFWDTLKILLYLKYSLFWLIETSVKNSHCIFLTHWFFCCNISLWFFFNISSPWQNQESMTYMDLFNLYISFSVFLNNLAMILLNLLSKSYQSLYIHIVKLKCCVLFMESHFLFLVYVSCILTFNFRHLWKYFVFTMKNYFKA